MAVALTFLTAQTSSPDNRYKYEIVAKTGQANLAQILPDTSINDLGVVAFVGQIYDNNGGGPLIENLFVGSGAPNSLTNISPKINSAFYQRFSPGVLINNLDEVLVRRLLNQPTPLGVDTVTYLEKWNADAPDQVIGLITAQPIGMEFRGIHSYPGFNNGFGVLFQGIDNNIGTCMATMTAQGYYKAPLSGELRRPVLADNNTFVMRSGSAPYSIQLRSTSFSLIGTVADSAKGFGYVGRSPGVSDDGKIVAFYGEASSFIQSDPEIRPGPGIFAYINGRLCRVAGLANNKVVEPGEAWVDTVRNGRFDADQGETDLGPFTGFDPDGPICVNNGGYVLYVANDAHGRAIYYSRVNAESGGTGFNAKYACTDPTRVIGVCDTVNGLAGTLDNVVIFDSINNAGEPGDIAFYCHTTEGDEAIVSAEVVQQPLIFVPGIIGSSLIERTANNGEVERWFSSFDSALDALANVPGSFYASDALRQVWKPSWGIGLMVYGEILDYLTLKAGYRRYDDKSRPEYRVWSGWNDADNKRHPTLFIFPYDWRLSNGESARGLADYVDGIRRSYDTMYGDSHADTKVNILAHSMGGLVSRRYLIDHPGQHNVDKLVTIGSPFDKATLFL